MLKGEHLSGDFLRKFPAAEIPVLVDGHKLIYGGGSMTIVKHLCNRFPRCAERFRIRDFRKEMDMMYAWVNKNIKPITIKVQKLEMLTILKKDMEHEEERKV